MPQPIESFALAHAFTQRCFKYAEIDFLFSLVQMSDNMIKELVWKPLRQHWNKKESVFQSLKCPESLKLEIIWGL